MLQAAINSCSVACNLMLTRALSIEQEVFINPNVAVFSTAQALLVGTGQGAAERHWPCWVHGTHLFIPSPSQPCCLSLTCAR